MDEVAAAVGGAAVQVEDAARGLSFATNCGAHGDFLFPHLPTGTYAVTISAAGFSTLVLYRVSVEVGATTELEIRLKVAGVRSMVTVTEDADEGVSSIEQPSGAAIASVIGNHEMDSLPINGQRWQSFTLLSPAANAGDAEDGLLSFRGLAVTENSTTVDGMDDDQSFNAAARGSESVSDDGTEEETGVEPGGARRRAGSRRRSGASYTFSQQAVREFRVDTQNYTALYGHGAGGVIATVSKSGTNGFHGTAFYRVRSSAWAATNLFSIATRYHDGEIASGYVKPHDLRQQFGGTVGGAVARDRLFYFYAFDQQRHGDAAISSPGEPSFYSLTATQRTLLANRGVTAAKVNAALNYLDSLTGTVNRRDDQTIHFGKLDWQISPRQRATLQYNRVRSSLPAGLRGAPVVDRGVASLGSGYTKIDAGLARWTWTPSKHFADELLVAYGRDFQFEQPQAPLPQEPAVGPGGFAPEVRIGPDGIAFGTPAGLGRRAYPDERRLQFADTATWNLGRHLLQAGADVSFVSDEVDALKNAAGTFQYDSGSTNGRAGGLVDWITDYTFNVNAYPNGGCPSIHAAVHLFCFRSFTQSFGEDTVDFDTQEWAAFVEDTWRPRANLTIHAGLRYEYELLPLPQHPNVALDTIFRDRGATSVFPEDRNNVGPRVGAAWAPFGSGRGVVRAGYGVYYGRVPGATLSSALANTAQASSSTHVQITPSTITACPQVAGQGFGYVCTYLSAPPATVVSTTSATVFSRRFRTPLVQQGSLAVERGVGAGVVVSAAYLMNLDRQLPGSVDLNIAPSTGSTAFQIQGGAGAPGLRDGETFVLPVYMARVSDSYGPVTAVMSEVGASYHGLALEARRRARKGFEFRAAWTWSKAIDEGQNTGAVPRLNSQLDPFTVRYDKGLSRLNFPQKFVASTVWEPRVRATEPWARRAMNGWTISGIFYETSGRPYSYEIFGGTRLSGGRESINGSGGAVYLPTVGRNTLRLPETVRLDMRVVRAVRVSERVRMRGTIEAFNVANHVNVTGVEQRAFLVGAPSGGVTPLVFQDAAAVSAEGLNVLPFGTHTEAAANLARERQLQVGLQVEF
jgi:hypothetical protein